MAYKDLKAPKKDMEELDEDLMMDELDLGDEALDEDVPGPGMMPELKEISDDDLLAELRSRGLLDEEDEEASDEDDMEELDFGE